MYFQSAAATAAATFTIEKDGTANSATVTGTLTESYTILEFYFDGTNIMGYFDNVLDFSPDTISTSEIENEEIFYGVYDLKCGDGTVLDPDTDFCVPDKVCGPGLVYDPDTNLCNLE